MFGFICCIGGTLGRKCILCLVNVENTQNVLKQPISVLFNNIYYIQLFILMESLL